MIYTFIFAITIMSAYTLIGMNTSNNDSMTNNSEHTASIPKNAEITYYGKEKGVQYAKVDISGYTLTDVNISRSLKTQIQPAQLYKFTAQYCNLTDIDFIDIVSSFEHLKILDLAYNKIKCNADLIEHHSLRELHLEYNDLEDAYNLPYLLSCFKQLKVLNINGNAITSLQEEHFTYTDLYPLESLVTIKVGIHYTNVARLMQALPSLNYATEVTLKQQITSRNGYGAQKSMQKMQTERERLARRKEKNIAHEWQSLSAVIGCTVAVPGGLGGAFLGSILGDASYNIFRRYYPIPRIIPADLLEVVTEDDDHDSE